MKTFHLHILFSIAAVFLSLGVVAFILHMPEETPTPKSIKITPTSMITPTTRPTLDVSKALQEGYSYYEIAEFIASDSAERLINVPSISPTPQVQIRTIVQQIPVCVTAAPGITQLHCVTDGKGGYSCN